LNPSGITYSPLYNNIYNMDWIWLSAGPIRWCIDYGGIPRVCHEADNINNLTEPFLQSPNLPLRVEISNDGTGPAASIDHICSVVLSEGGRERTGVPFTIDTGATPLTTLNNSSLYPVLACRIASTSIGIDVRPLMLNISCPSTALFRWSLILNPTITGTALSWSAVTNSGLEKATPTNATTVSGGYEMQSGYFESANGASSTTSIIVDTDLRMGSNIARTTDVLVLAVQRLTGTTEDFYAAMALQVEV
jgi:hypothetical protein